MSLKRNASGCYDSTAYEAIMNVQGGGSMDVLRGDIFYVMKNNNVIGKEMEAGRPAIIVSNDIGNEKSGVVEVVYLTTSNKRMDMPTHINIIARVPSVAICEQIHTVSKDRLGYYMKSCTTSEMKAIDDALKISLGLENDNSNLEAKNAEVEKLKNQLKEAGAKIKKLKSELKESKEALETLESDKEKLINTVNEKNYGITKLSNELKAKENELIAIEELKYKQEESNKAELDKIELDIYTIQLETERDLYKQQYEALFERLISK